MFIKKYKNNLLQHYVCANCNRVWNDDGEEVTDNYLLNKIRKCNTTITVICPMCDLY